MASIFKRKGKKGYWISYYQRPGLRRLVKGGNKEKAAREYANKPEAKARAKELQQSPEARAKQKEIRERPENKARAKEYRLDQRLFKREGEMLNIMKDKPDDKAM